MVESVTFTPGVQRVRVPQKAEMKAAETDGGSVNSASEENDKGKEALVWTSLAALGALGIGLLLRKPKLVREAAIKPGGIVKEAETGITRNIKDAEAVRNVDVSHVDSKTRKVVTEALEDVPTEKEVKAYQAEHAYLAPTAEESRSIEELNIKNAKERAEVNTIANLAKGAEKLKESAKGTASVTGSHTVSLAAPAEEIKNQRSFIKTLKNSIKKAEKTKNFKEASRLKAQLKAEEDKLSKMLPKTAPAPAAVAKAA